MRKVEIMNFKEFEIFENVKMIEENFLNDIFQKLKKVGEYFKGLGSTFLNAIIAQVKGETPNGVRIYPSDLDIDILQRSGVTVKVPPLPGIESKEEIQDSLTALAEAEVKLEHPNPKILNVSLPELLDEVEKAIVGASRGVTLIVWGAPGIGKTSIVGTIARQYYGPDALEKRRMIDCTVSQMQPEDFTLPYTTTDAAGARVSDDAPKRWLPVYHVEEGAEGDKRVNGPDGKGGILFLDELSRANDPVKNLCLKLINERRIGQYIIGSKWAIIAASNRSEDDPLAGDLQGAITNRFTTQVNYVPDVETWGGWALKATDSKTEELLVDPEIVAFLKFAGQHFYSYDPETSKEIFPTPRTWQAVTTNLRALRELRKTQGRTVTLDDIERQAAQAVGTDVAKEFVAFLSLMREVPLEQLDIVYSDPERAPLPTRSNTGSSEYDFKSDVAYAMISGIVFRKRNVKLEPHEVDNLMKYVRRLGPVWASVCLKFIKDIHPELVNLDPSQGKRTEQQKTFSLGMKALVDKFPGMVQNVRNIEN